MEFVDALCTSCGAHLKLNENLERAFCQYCGNELVVKQAIEKIKLDRSEEFDNLLLLALEELNSKNYEAVRSFCKEMLIINPESYDVRRLMLIYYNDSSFDLNHLRKQDDSSKLLLLPDKNYETLKKSLKKYGFYDYSLKMIINIKSEFVTLQYLASRADEIYVALKKAYESSQTDSQYLEISEIAEKLFRNLTAFPMLYDEDIDVYDKTTYPDRWIVFEFLTIWLELLSHFNLLVREEIKEVLVRIFDYIKNTLKTIKVLKYRNYYMVLLNQISKFTGFEIIINSFDINDEITYLKSINDELVSIEEIKNFETDDSPFKTLVNKTIYLGGEEFKFNLLDPINVNYRKRTFNTQLIVEWDEVNEDYIELILYNQNEDILFEKNVSLDTITPLKIPITVRKRDLERNGDFYNFTLGISVSYYEYNKDDEDYDEIDHVEFNFNQHFKQH